MKKTLFFSFLLTLIFLLLLLPTSAKVYEGDAVNREEVNEQVAYYDIQYRFDTETGELRIYCGAAGEQAMLSYVYTQWVPWLKDDLRGKVETVIIEEGVLAIGQNAFFGCENLKTVYIPSSVTSIEESVFYSCNSLEKICYAGNKASFQEKVIYQETRNYILVGDERVDALTFLQYGETVSVELQNQNGDVFERYTVGGYFPGDKYTVTAKEVEHMTYKGESRVIEGSFKEGDSTVVVLTYDCDHAYAVSAPDKPCGSFCTWCGGSDPAFEDAHTWKYRQNQKRGIFKDLIEDKYCTVCGTKRHTEKPAYIIYILIALGALLVAGGIALAIILPIRRKKKMQELTW